MSNNINSQDIANPSASELTELALEVLQSAQEEGQASPTALVQQPHQELTNNAPPEDDQEWVQPTGEDLRARLAIITNNIL